MRTAWLLVLLLLAPSVFAHGDAIGHGEEIATQAIACSELSDDQLAAVGEYVMEQMHPGEAHERMDAMMTGGDPSRSADVHIAVARQHYCGREELYLSVEDCSAGGCAHGGAVAVSSRPWPVGSVLIGAGILVLAGSLVWWWRDNKLK